MSVLASQNIKNSKMINQLSHTLLPFRFISQAGNLSRPKLNIFSLNFLSFKQDCNFLKRSSHSRPPTNEKLNELTIKCTGDQFSPLRRLATTGLV